MTNIVKQPKNINSAKCISVSNNAIKINYQVQR